MDGNVSLLVLRLRMLRMPKLAFKPKLFSAFAAAEFNTLRMIPAALFGVNVKIAMASATLLPRMLSRTRRDLRVKHALYEPLLAEVISAIYVLYFRVFLSSAA